MPMATMFLFMFILLTVSFFFNSLGWCCSLSWVLMQQEHFQEFLFPKFRTRIVCFGWQFNFKNSTWNSVFFGFQFLEVCVKAGFLRNSENSKIEGRYKFASLHGSSFISWQKHTNNILDAGILKLNDEASSWIIDLGAQFFVGTSTLLD